MGGKLKLLNHKWFNIDLRNYFGFRTNFMKWAIPFVMATFCAQNLHSAPQTPSQALPKMFQKQPSLDYYQFKKQEQIIPELPAIDIKQQEDTGIKIIPETQIRDHIQSLLDLESIKYDEESLVLIASSAQGSIRDQVQDPQAVTRVYPGLSSISLVSEAVPAREEGDGLHAHVEPCSKASGADPVRTAQELRNFLLGHGSYGPAFCNFTVRNTLNFNLM